MAEGQKPQKILIIGGNRGVGFELVKRLRALRHDVTASYRAATKDDESVVQLRETGARLIELDVADESTIVEAAETINQDSLDILFHVAGIYQLWDDKPYTDHTAEDLLWHFRVNVVGPFLTSKYFLPALQKSETGGRIINVSSDMASIEGGNLCYRLSKTGVNQLSKTSSLDLQRLAKAGANSTIRPVQVLAVHPGYVATKMTGYYGEDDMDECMDGLVDIVRRFGQPGEEENLPNGGYVRWNGAKMAY